MSTRASVVALLVLASSAFSPVSCGVALVLAQNTDDAVQKALIDRFTTVLEKSPRRGTAFDKVYDHHVDRGTLDEILKEYRRLTQVVDGTATASAWMIVGLIEDKRGNDAEAIHAYSMAESLNANDALASYYLGQLHVLAGNTDEAAAAFERAMARKPSAADLLEILQSLGRVYQRARMNEKALDVWNRLEQHFPGDARVREQIATILLEEDDLQGALTRFESLAQETRDKYRQAQFRVEIADIKLRLGQSEQGLKDFEDLLKQLNPDNWMFKDIRRRVEAVYLKANDQAGLITYYEKCIDKDPSDADAVARLARLLTSIGRGRHARECLQKGLKRAPSNKELRRALINLLLTETDFQAAVEQYEELDKYEPGNPDTLREWGRMLLRDSTLDDATRQQRAAAVWRRMMSNRPGDAVAASQVADLFRRAGLTDDAVECYRRAIEIAPESAQYREYLGEYFHSLKRPDDALVTWREIAAGSRRTAPNIARLAEILAHYGSLDEAIRINGEACRLDPKDLNLQLKQADLLSKAERHEAALQQLEAAARLVSDDEEREAWQRRELAELKELKRLPERIEQVRQELKAATDKPHDAAERWYWLAQAYEAAEQPKESAAAIGRAVQFNPNSLRMLAAAARINEAALNLQAAAELYERLASVDKRFRSEHLKRLSILLEKLGHRDRAIQAARDLMLAAPGSTEASDYFAQMCFRMNRHDEGIQALRRSLRINPGDIPTLLRLASALAAKQQPVEAIELMWRAFDRASNLEQRLTVIQNLAEVLNKQKQMNSLYIRLERERRDPARYRDMTYCLAKAYELAGDPVNALRKLETLITEGTPDLDLLFQLRALAERQQDHVSAVRFQKKVLEVTGLPRERMILMRLLLLAGKTGEAVDLMNDNAEAIELSGDALKLLDTLNSQGHRDEYLKQLARCRKQYPDDWELLYREAVALQPTAPEIARGRFEALLAMNRSLDDPSALGMTASFGLHQPFATTTSLPLVKHVGNLNSLSQALSQQRSVASLKRTLSQQQTTSQQTKSAQATTVFYKSWSPPDYGAARMAAWWWLLQLFKDGPGGQEEFLSQLSSTPVSRQQCADRMALFSFVRDYKSKCHTARQMMLLSKDDVEARILYILSLAELRHPPPDPSGAVKRSGPVLLTDEQLEELEAAHALIATRSDVVPWNTFLLSAVMEEFIVAGKTGIAKRLYSNAASKVATIPEISHLLFSDQESPDLTVTCHLLEKLAELQAQARLNQLPGANSQLAMPHVVSIDFLPQLMFSAMKHSSDPDLMLTTWSHYVRMRAANGIAGTSRTVTLIPGQGGHQAGFNGQVTFSGILYNATSHRITISQVESRDAPGFALAPDARQLMSLIHAAFKAAGRLDELVASLKRSADTSTAGDEDRLLWKHSLAYALWLDDKDDEAVRILADVVNEFPARKSLRRSLIDQYALTDQATKALDLLQTMQADGEVEQRELDLLAIRLAIAADQKDRANPAIERLMSRKVEHKDLVTLAAQMRQLEMSQQAEALLVRFSETEKLDLGPLWVLMDLQLELNKNQEAAENATRALALLERGKPGGPAGTVTYQSSIQNGRVVLTPIVAKHEELKQHALSVLHASGYLKQLIESEEIELEKAPRTVSLISKLIEMHGAAGNMKRQDELIVRRLQLDADRPPGKILLALKYLDLGRIDEAQEQFQQVLDQDPELFASRARETLFRFDGRKDQLEFARLLGRLKWNGTYRQLNAMPSLISQLWAREPLSEIGDRLFLGVWQAFPDRRIDLAHRFAEDRWWRLKEVREGWNSVLLPPADGTLDRQWEIFGRVIRYEQDDERMVTIWNQLLAFSKADASLDSLQAVIQSQVKKSPDWTAGVAMLALIDLKQGRIESGRDALDQLLPKLEKVLQDQNNMAFEIAQELVHHEQSLDVGDKYFRIAIKKGGPIDWNSKSSPAVALLKAYLHHNRPQAAKKLVLDRVPEEVRRDGDPSKVPSAVDITQANSTARTLRSLDYPLDAIDVYVTVLDRTRTMQVSGYDPRIEVRNSLETTFAELNSESLAVYLKGLDPRSGPFCLPLFVRPTDQGRGRLQGCWEPLLHGIAMDTELLSRTEIALDKVCQARPTEMAPRILSAQLSLAAGKMEAFAATCDRLVQMIEQRPLQKDGKPLAKPHDIAEQAALWLVARDCLTQPSLALQGKLLGQRALDACRLIPDNERTLVILNHWIQIAEAAEQFETVARLQIELKNVTKR